jgi:hypothetical protein
VADAKCDAVRLAQIVDRCFDYAMDARLSQARRTKFLVAGIEHSAAVLKDLGTLTGALDKLLATAVLFV